MQEQVYSLEQLADEFGLTARTVRYYLEKVLPEHHRSGPGRVGQYGQETWNCFEFIRRAKKEKLTLQQIADVLKRIDQEQIDRVANGMEDLTIVPMAPGWEPSARRMASAAQRFRNYRDIEAYTEDWLAPSKMEQHRPTVFEAAAEGQPTHRWRVLYGDDELRITHTGDADREQCKQIELVAELIKTILRRK